MYHKGLDMAHEKHNQKTSLTFPVNVEVVLARYSYVSPNKISDQPEILSTIRYEGFSKKNRTF